MKPKTRAPLVFFNASVILAGLRSHGGGSAKLLSWHKQKLIKGIVNEIVVDEVVRNASKTGLIGATVKRLTNALFPKVIAAPSLAQVKKYQRIVVDYGDAHLLASAFQVKAKFLVTLDKKHVLALKNKVKRLKIVSPKQLIELLSL